MLYTFTTNVHDSSVPLPQEGEWTTTATNSDDAADDLHEHLIDNGYMERVKDWTPGVFGRQLNQDEAQQKLADLIVVTDDPMLCGACGGDEVQTRSMTDEANDEVYTYDQCQTCGYWEA